MCVTKEKKESVNLKTGHLKLLIQGKEEKKKNEEK
jgi:hypothetical protein